MSSWHSYPSIYNLGHRAIVSLLDAPVQVEEKVDGSQFSFGIFGGVLRVRSKGQEMQVDAPERMFATGVSNVREIAHRLYDGWTYRGEYLQKPKHNTLAYDRVPSRNVIIFDINTEDETYLDADARAVECERLGFECVPVLYSGMVNSADKLRSLLETTSVLGGQKIEGVVIKPIGYSLFGLDKKALMGKFVSEAFKEVHNREWKKANPGSGDIVDQISMNLRSEARWNKSIQHLAERGALEWSPRDIGSLMKEVVADVEKECADQIREELYRYAWPHIRRKIVAGLPEWYKQKLLEAQFEHDTQH